MSKANQQVFMMAFAAVIAGGIALKFGRSLPVIGDAAEGYGG